MICIHCVKIFTVALLMWEQNRFPKINCQQCNYPLISCGDSTYYENCLDPHFWWFHETINTVGFLIQHFTHKEDLFFLDGSFLQDEDKIIAQPKLMNLKNAEIVTVLHKNNHFAAVSVTLTNLFPKSSFTMERNVTKLFGGTMD